MTYRRAISRRRYLTSRHFYTRVDLDDVANELTDRETGPMQLDDAIDRKAENGRVQTIFAALSEDQRQTLALFFIEGYTLDEIAAQLGQSEGTSNTTTSAAWKSCEKSFLVANCRVSDQYDKRCCPTWEWGRCR